MQSNWATENLQVIRTLMERSALYRRALAPIMLTVGVIGLIAGTVGWFFDPDSAITFLLLWLTTGFVALGISFLLVRRQALKDHEPFWSPPTRRVAFALAPPLVVGFVMASGTLLFEITHRAATVPLATVLAWWMILYGCALHSAGFFMTRGIRWLGWIFILCGVIPLVIRETGLDFNALKKNHLLMGATFGGLHLAYGIYLYFTEKKISAA